MQSPILETVRLTIRLATSKDALAIASYFSTNLEHLRSSSPIFPEGILTKEHWLEKIEQNIADYNSDKAVRFFLFSKTGADVIGTVNFSQIFRGGFQACYLGYGLDQDLQGQGYMHEALKETINFIFGPMNLHRIMANHAPSNTRSANVLKRLGFQVEGLAKDYLMLNDKWEDHVLTSLTNTGWAQIQ